MSNQTLRQLARDYSRGAIGKDKYRQSRTELIQGIVAGDIAVKAIDYEAPLMPSNELDDAITEGIVRDATEITSPQAKIPKPIPSPAVKQNNIAATNNKKKSPLIFILVSSIIVLSLILAVALFYPKPPETMVIKKPRVSDNSQSSNNATTTTINNTVGETLIANFLSEKNWSEDSLNSFIESWTTLSQEEKDSAKQTKRMQRMKDSIYKQFLEGKAFASIDSEKAIMKQQKLIEFAEAIEIDDSRLTID
jgi:hypothetical protein